MAEFVVGFPQVPSGGRGPYWAPTLYTVVNGKYRFVKRLTEVFTGNSNSERIKGFRSLRKAEAYTQGLGGLPEGWKLVPDARHGGIPEGWTLEP